MFYLKSENVFAKLNFQESPEAGINQTKSLKRTVGLVKMFAKFE